MLRHRDDIPGIRLAVAIWRPPVLGRLREGGFAGGVATAHVWAELPGGVVFESATQDFFDRASFYERNHVRVYRLMDAGDIIAMLGRDSWEEATQAEQFRYGDRIRYEVMEHTADYLRRHPQFGVYSPALLAMMREELRRKHGW